MTAPQIQRYIDFLSHDTFGNTTPIYDEVTCHNIDQIFAVLACLEHNRMDGYDLWLKIPRGTIKDYGDYQEWLEFGDVENYAEFEAMWRSDYLQLAGSAWTRTIETVIFFLALHRAGLPVTILDVDILKERLTGTEKIGVVPEGIFPDYCQSLFQSEKIIAFMNLPYENREEFAKRCVWQPVAPVRLKDCAETSGEVKFFESSCTECPN